MVISLLSMRWADIAWLAIQINTLVRRADQGPKYSPRGITELVL